MTQEDKKLLLIDLCARLPYGIKVKSSRRKNIVTLSLDVMIDFHLGCSIKPYLRSIEDITEEETKEVKTFYDCDLFDRKINIVVAKLIDWLNSYHFDYRNLISKGLAIRVTKENNPYIDK